MKYHFLYFSLLKISLFEICVLFHQYSSLFHKLYIIKTNSYTGPFIDFGKGGCEFHVFHKRDVILKKIPISWPKLEVLIQFLVKNCMILK